MIRKIARFYMDGFRGMALGRALWWVILVKLAVIFLVLRLFFFQPYLQGTEEEKGEAVGRELSERITTQ